jgi:hypothetical protein
MKRLALLYAMLNFTANFAHCPCNGTPCDPSKPCGPCAQEQTKSKAPTQAAGKPSAPMAPAAPPQLIRSVQAAAHLARINEKQAAFQAALAERIAKIEHNNSIVPPQHVPVAALLATTITVPAEHPAPTTTQQQVNTTHSYGEKTELEWHLIKAISTALTPLVTAYPTEKLIPLDPTKSTLDDQLEQIHTVSTFLTKLKIKLELLKPEEREFIKTASFAGNPIARMLNKTLLSLQSLFESQLADYKQVKPQSTLVKELKKLVTASAKEVDGLCKELFMA